MFSSTEISSAPASLSIRAGCSWSRERFRYRAEFSDPLAGIRLFSLHPRGLPYKDYISSVSKKFPLTAHDLQLAHQRWPGLAHWAEQLQAQWPPPIGGCHRLILDDGRVTLDLWLGDINDLTDKAR